MKKSLIALLVITVLAVSLGGCSKEEALDLPIGTYEMKDTSQILTPYINLKDGNEFIFVFSALSSQLPIGTYSIVKDELVLTIDDEEKITYVFKIDNGDLVFQADKSASIPKFEKEDSIVDGDIFVYKQNN